MEEYKPSIFKTGDLQELESCEWFSTVDCIEGEPTATNENQSKMMLVKLAFVLNI